MNNSFATWLVALGMTVGIATAAAAQSPPPPPPNPPASPPAAPHPAAPPDIDAQLEAARKNLEAAARDVARLSTELSGSVLERVMPLVDPGHVIIGVQLESADGQHGARVRAVSPGGPAEEAGVRPGDVIVAVNGMEIQGSDPGRQVVSILHKVKPDSRVALRILRAGRPQELTVTARSGLDLLAKVHGLPDMQDFEFWDLTGGMAHGALRDLQLVTLTPQLGSYFGAEQGVLVVHTGADSPLNLQDGDVILAIDGRQPTSGSHVTRILSSYQPGETYTLHILRQHKTLDLKGTVSESRGHGGHDAAFGHSRGAPRGEADDDERT